MLWENLTSNEFPAAVEAAKGVCVLPVGCVEKHGAHLPLGTDVMHVTSVVKAAAEKEPVVVFPTMYFGEKTGAGEYPGTIIFSAELRLAILKESCREIARNGFRKVLIYNGHGGNSAMTNFFARSMLYEKEPKIMVFTANQGLVYPKEVLEKDFDYLTADDRKVLESYVERRDNAPRGTFATGHACFAETGLMLASRPDLVKLNLMDAESGESTHRFDEFGKMGIQTHFEWMGNYPNSYTSTYHPGMNERIARAMFDVSVETTAARFKFLKEETVSDTYFEEWKKKQR